MSDASRRRPAFEALEPRALLSAGAAAAVKPATVGIVSAAADLKHAPLALQGSLRGESLLQAANGRLAASIDGAGPLRPLGRLAVSGTINFDAQGRETSGALILVAPRGKLFAGVQQVDPTSGSYQYSINGGTKAYLYASGSGSLSIQAVGGLSLSQQAVGLDRNSHTRLRLEFE
jgi:hypothetical protein